MPRDEQLRQELLELGAARPHTQAIQTILFHPSFPVDIRHNAKIFREKLADWAAEAAVMNALVTGGGGFLGGAIVRRWSRAATACAACRAPLSRTGRSRRRADPGRHGRPRSPSEQPRSRLRRGLSRRGQSRRLGSATPTTIAPTSLARKTSWPPVANTASAGWSTPVRRAWSSTAATWKASTNRRRTRRITMRPYPRTKAEAERLVLAANGPDLATVALRPHLIWGPGDNHLIPRILARGGPAGFAASAGPIKLIDSIYIDNAADAHLLAADRLAPGSSDRRQGVFPVAGRAVALVGSDQSHSGDAAGLPPVTRTVPAGWPMRPAGCWRGVHGAGPPRRAADDALPGARTDDGPLVRHRRGPARPGV